MSARVAPAPSDPPSIAELAEQTRRSAPPPPPRENRDPDDVASFMEGFDQSDLRYPFDSILPATLDATALEDQTPATPFDLVNERPSSFGLMTERPARAHHLAAFAGLALLSALAVAAPRFRLATPTARAGAPTRRSMTPAEAASWASAPFTVELPVEAPSAPPRAALAHREVAVRPPHFDLEGAAVALAEAKTSLSDCEDADEATAPVGARASVTFSPEGSVTDVRIEPAPETKAVSACVVDRLRAVQVAPFAGPSVTVRTTLALFPSGPKP